MDVFWCCEANCNHFFEGTARAGWKLTDLHISALAVVLPGKPDHAPIPPAIKHGNWKSPITGGLKRKTMENHIFSEVRPLPSLISRG